MHKDLHTYISVYYELIYSFLVEIENDGMEPSKHYYFDIARNTRISSHKAHL